MDCINIICFYLKKYISDEQFESIFYEHIDDFQKSIREDIYYDLLSASFSSKQEIISLNTQLHNYVLGNYKSVYDNINDAYVERIIESNDNDIILKLLPKMLPKGGKGGGTQDRSASLSCAQDLDLYRGGAGKND